VPEDVAGVASLLLRTIAKPEAGTDQLILDALIRSNGRTDYMMELSSIDAIVHWPFAVITAAVSGLRLRKAKNPPDDPVSKAASLLARTSAAESKIVAEKVAADPENLPALRKTAADLRKAGVSSRTKKETLLSVVTWMVLLGFPAAIPMVPATDQGIVVNEIATVGLAIAITDHIRREKD
jgi:hypothetical protein